MTPSAIDISTSIWPVWVRVISMSSPKSIPCMIVSIS
jgi:hypothetical protein